MNNNAASQEVLRSEAWELLGITGSRPGILMLAEGRFAFYTEEGCVWDVAVQEITRLEFPWYYFGGGMKLQVGQERYRLSFVRPNNGAHITDRALIEALGVAAGPLALLSLGQTAHDIGTGWQAGKAWRAALTTERS